MLGTFSKFEFSRYYLFRDLDMAKEEKNAGKQAEILAKIEAFETHVVPMICDIDAGYGNEEATYLLAKKMIEAGACCIQLENQVRLLSRFWSVFVDFKQFLSIFVLCLSIGRFMLILDNFGRFRSIMIFLSISF